MENKYIHSETVHNIKEPSIIVPEIIKLLNPKSVVDIGCGLGTFLYCFKQEGVKDILGVDGSWVNRDLLSKYLEPNEFLEKDLEKKLVLEKKYDLVVSLEVAEHLSDKAADTFVQSLVSAGKVVLFSAAIPLQGGQNHINEQWLTYWEEKFLKHDFELHDVIRPIFWDNTKISVWYKQNMVIFAPKGFSFDSKVVYNPLIDVVHPELFNLKTQQLKHLINHNNDTTLHYLKCLIRSIIGNKTSYVIKKIIKKIFGRK